MVINDIGLLDVTCNPMVDMLELGNSFHYICSWFLGMNLSIFWLFQFYKKKLIKACEIYLLLEKKLYGVNILP